MKRYNITIRSPRGIPMEESPDGEWVQYDDVIRFLRIQEQMEKAHTLAVKRLKAETLECNCLKQAEEPTGLELNVKVYHQRWICPAHGYKRL